MDKGVKKTSPKESSEKQQPTPESGVIQEILHQLRNEAPDLLKSLPPRNQARLVQTTLRVGMAYSGPLPPPELLAEYNEVIPDGANRIMIMAEKQTDHRIKMESLVVSSQQKQSGRGQIFGLVIGIFGITVGGLLAYLGHDVVGGTIAGTTVVALGSAFIYGKRTQQANLQRKAQ